MQLHAITFMERAKSGKYVSHIVPNFDKKTTTKLYCEEAR